LAGKKLTSDQKRALRKREEEKRNRQRQHERNRRLNSMDDLIVTVRLAAMGESGPAEVEASVLKVCQAKSITASLKETRFKSRAWDLLRDTTSRMVSMTRGHIQLMEREMALLGRLYMIDQEEQWYDACFFPIETAVASGWDLAEVFSSTAQEMDPAPREGAYFFGLPLLSSAIHIAIAGSTDPSVPEEVYLVTENGWHAINNAVWRRELMPIFIRGMAARTILSELDDISYAAEVLLQRQPHADDEAADSRQGVPVLDRESRAVVRCLGSNLVDEMDAFIQASEGMKAAGQFAAYRDGLAAGLREAAAEGTQLKAQLEQLRREVSDLRERTPSAACPPANDSAATMHVGGQDVSLAHRMAPLFS
jgi:hypothetical protein